MRSCPSQTAQQFEATHLQGAFTTDAELGVANDLDVALYARNGTDPWILLDQTTGTPEETNEGLWYSTEESFDEVQVFLIRRAPWSPCPAIFNPPGLGAGEPYGYSQVFFKQPISVP